MLSGVVPYFGVIVAYTAVALGAFYILRAAKFL